MSPTQSLSAILLNIVSVLTCCYCHCFTQPKTFWKNCCDIWRATKLSPLTQCATCVRIAPLISLSVSFILCIPLYFLSKNRTIDEQYFNLESSKTAEVLC